MLPPPGGGGAPFVLRFGRSSAFAATRCGRPFDVLKVDIECDALQRIHQHLATRLLIPARSRTMAACDPRLLATRLRGALHGSSLAGGVVRGGGTPGVL